jgi:hypothetical protein
MPVGSSTTAAVGKHDHDIAAYCAFLVTRNVVNGVFYCPCWHIVVCDFVEMQALSFVG